MQYTKYKDKTRKQIKVWEEKENKKCVRDAGERVPPLE